MRDIIVQMPRRVVVPETVINVDRNIGWDYPGWAKREISPITLKGPAEYKLADLEWELHPMQVCGGRPTGRAIREELVESGEILWHPGLQDATKIRDSVSVAEFQRYTMFRVAVFWPATLEYNEKTDVACLGVERGELIIFWKDLNSYFDSSFLAPKFLHSTEQ